MDKLDRVLHDDARVALDDGGFTQRVMRSLPPRAAAALEWWRPLLLVGAAALGSVLAFLFLPSGSALTQGYIDLAQNRGFTPAAVTVIAMVAVLAISSIVLAADTE